MEKETWKHRRKADKQEEARVLEGETPASKTKTQEINIPARNERQESAMFC